MTHWKHWLEVENRDRLELRELTAIEHDDSYGYYGLLDMGTQVIEDLAMYRICGDGTPTACYPPDILDLMPRVMYGTKRYGLYNDLPHVLHLLADAVGAECVVDRMIESHYEDIDYDFDSIPKASSLNGFSEFKKAVNVFNRINPHLRLWGDRPWFNPMRFTFCKSIIGTALNELIRLNRHLSCSYHDMTQPIELDAEFWRLVSRVDNL